MCLKYSAGFQALLATIIVRIEMSNSLANGYLIIKVIYYSVKSEKKTNLTFFMADHSFLI